MIAYILLGLGTTATAGVLYYVAPVARGLHRYITPRSKLRADIRRKDAQFDELACKFLSLGSELEGTYNELRGALIAKEAAEEQVADLEQQVKAFDAVCAHNVELSSALANATAVRQLYSGPSPADDASALPDELQEFADQTAAAWRSEVAR